MLDNKFIRENADAVRRAAELKGVDFDVDGYLRLLDEVRHTQTAVDEGHRQRRVISEQFKGATPDQREGLRESAQANDKELTANRDRLAELTEQLDQLKLKVPNIPWAGAPIGDSEDDNVVIRTWGEPRAFDFEPLDHVALLERRDWAEFERARHAGGARSYALKREAVLLERAMQNLGIELLIEQGFELISVSALAQAQALVGTGFLPGHAEEIYYLERDDIYLAGTSEVGMVGMAGSEIIEHKQLPRIQAGLSHCFRREIGSAGRDVRGLIRVHEFQKVEQFVVCEADEQQSASWHERLLETSERVLQLLELPYEVVECCTGDMGLGKVRMNDVNTWFPSLQSYRETHSCSTLHDWQARRANIRYRDADGKIRFPYTLNNTAVATPRLLAAFVENHQAADGSVRVPAALQPYLNGRAAL